MCLSLESYICRGGKEIQQKLVTVLHQEKSSKTIRDLINEKQNNNLKPAAEIYRIDCKRCWKEIYRCNI